MFLKGMKALCIDGKFPKIPDLVGAKLPKEGDIYTIREVISVDGGTGLLFEELQNSRIILSGSSQTAKEEPYFNAKRFQLAPSGLILR